jgi:hypothetical protein
MCLDLELVSRRRLGQTTLKIREGHEGNSSSIKPEHLGTFEYAHLRVSLPENLKGTEMFNTPHPDTYFFMVRST